jgi:hypothetical protein
MKIRATKKLLNIARIKVIKDLSPLTDKMPGEWFASIVTMGMPGKLGIHFLHYPTLVSAIIPEKSLNRAIKELPDHLASLLKRQGFSKMFSEYQPNTLPEIYSTNSRSMLAYMNDMSYTIEHHLSRHRPIVEIEDIEFENLFGGKLGGVDYITPKQILSEYMNKMVSR